MKRALITGGAGFVGAHLGRHLLARGYRVDLLDSLARGVQDEDFAALVSESEVSFVEADLLAADSLAALGGDYTHVFHLAAIVGVRHVLERPYAVLTDNMRMLTAAIEFARRQKRLERFLFASTSEVYGGTLRHFGLPFPTPETTPLAIPDLADARTSYMLSKIYGEASCRQAGIPCTLFRPHNFYGPRMGLSHVIPELLRRAHETPDDGELDVYSADHRRTFCYIDDAVEWMARAGENPDCEGEALNLGTQEPEVTMRELGEIVIDVVGKRLAVHPREATPGSPPRRCPDISRVVELTGHRPQVDLRDGVERTFAWYRKRIFDGPDESAV